MALIHLPPELIFMIAELLDSTDQAAFGLCCTRFRGVCNRALYYNNVRLSGSSCVYSAIENYENISAILGSLRAAQAVGTDFNKIWPYEIHPVSPRSQDSRDFLGRWEYVPSQQRYGTALHLAAKRGLDAVVDFLLTEGPTINNENNLENTPLYVALAYKNEVTARVLIDQGMSLASETSRINALHIAAACGLHDTAKYLVTEKGLDINSQDRNGDTPLVYALMCIDGPNEMISQLLQCGACINLMTRSGEQSFSPLDLALHIGKFGAARKLLNCGAAPSTTGLSQPGSLEIACLRKAERCRGRSVQDKKYIIARLIDMGLDPNQRISIKPTLTGPLLLKLGLEGLQWEQRYLLKSGRVQIDDRDSYGFTSLDWAIRVGDHRSAGLLLRCGANISHRSVTLILKRVGRWISSESRLRAAMSQWKFARVSHVIIKHCLQLQEGERDHAVTVLLDKFPRPIFELLEELTKEKRCKPGKAGDGYSKELGRKGNSFRGSTAFETLTITAREHDDQE